MKRRIGHLLALGAAVCALASFVASMGAGDQDIDRTGFQDSDSRSVERSGYIVASS